MTVWKETDILNIFSCVFSSFEMSDMSRISTRSMGVHKNIYKCQFISNISQ